jgi:GNAT superfamily N-acetyltransferase
MSDSAVIRNAAPGESRLLSNLAFRSKAVWGYSSEFMESCRDELTVERDQIAAHDAFHVVCEIGGEVVGFYVLRQISSTVFDLHALFIDPGKIGNGHGRFLMAHALQNVAKHGGLTLQIQSDPNATKFYEAAGAYRIGLLESGSIPGRQLPLLQIDVGVISSDAA